MEKPWTPLITFLLLSVSLSVWVLMKDTAFTQTQAIDTPRQTDRDAMSAGKKRI